jgi:hypothetical protein
MLVCALEVTHIFCPTFPHVFYLFRQLQSLCPALRLLSYKVPLFFEIRLDLMRVSNAWLLNDICIALRILKKSLIS